MLTYLDLANVEVKFKYNVYNYDPSRQDLLSVLPLR
jgi:hypothetical protein